MAPAPKYSAQEQEDLILNAAADCIWESSLTDFTMASVSRASNLSMGSIYKHVQCKEDIIFALAVRTFSHLRNVFTRVLSLELTTPEKLIAIALLSPEKTQVYPFDSQLEAMLQNEAIIKRASEAWTDRVFILYQECEKSFSAIFSQAIGNQELVLEGETNQAIENMNRGCWAMLVGFNQVQRTIQLRDIIDGTSTVNKAAKVDSALIVNMQRFVNSFNWKQPLTLDGIHKAADILEQMELR